MSREEKEDGEAAPTLLERLDHWAQTQPDKVSTARHLLCTHVLTPPAAREHQT